MSKQSEEAQKDSHIHSLVRSTRQLPLQTGQQLPAAEPQRSPIGQFGNLFRNPVVPWAARARAHGAHADIQH